MNTGPNTRHEGEEPQAPQKLVAALKEIPSRHVFVPPTIDEAVLRAARKHLTRPQRAKCWRFRPWIVWPATAVVCLLLAVLGNFVMKQPRTAFAREDVNHDGQVDVLDAFQLARGVQVGMKQSSELDLNGDGVIDRRDVEFIAAKAVKLEKGGKS